MKFGEIGAMESRVVHGAWMEPIAFPGVRLKVRGLGNPDYQRARAKAAAAQKVGDEIPPDELVKIIGDTLLVDWNGIEDRDYSKEAAGEALQASVFREAVFECAMRVAVDGQATVEAIAKN
jgi:hypothetical protein